MKRKIVVVGLMLLVTTLFCGCINQEATQIVLGQSYSNFGFSLKYSNDMALEEQGFVNVYPDENSGILFGDVLYENTDTYHILKISWIYFGSINGSYTLEEILQNSIEAGFLLIDTDAATVTKSDIQTSTIENYKLMYQPYKFENGGTVLNAVMGTWYCSENERIYTLNVGFNEKEVLTLFEKYVNSFQSYSA